MTDQMRLELQPVVSHIKLKCFLSQIKEKLLQLTDKRKEMIDKWEDRWEWLRLSKTYFLFIVHTKHPLKVMQAERSEVRADRSD